MVKAPLVNPGIQFGYDVLELLDRTRFPVSVAIWLKDNESDKWDIVLGTALYDREGARGAYLILLDALRSEGGRVILSDYPITLKSNRDPLIRGVRKLFGKVRDGEGKSLAGHVVAGKWIQDGYVYRIR